jgi:carbonic anhydrase
MQYAVEALKVKHIIVCGHYGCGGVKAALLNSRLGLIDNWLRHIQDVREKHAASLAEIKEESDRVAKLCELNIIEQVINVCQTTVVQNAWEAGQELTVHGWVYGLSDGLVRDLNVHIANHAEMTPIYQNAIAASRSTRAPDK